MDMNKETHTCTNLLDSEFKWLMHKERCNMAWSAMAIQLGNPHPPKTCNFCNHVYFFKVASCFQGKRLSSLSFQRVQPVEQCQPWLLGSWPNLPLPCCKLEWISMDFQPKHVCADVQQCGNALEWVWSVFFWVWINRPYPRPCNLLVAARSIPRREGSSRCVGPRWANAPQNSAPLTGSEALRLTTWCHRFFDCVAFQRAIITNLQLDAGIVSLYCQRKGWTCFCFLFLQIQRTAGG